MGGYSFLVCQPDGREGCARRHGQVSSLHQAMESAEGLPPLHPNCRCRMVLLDWNMAALYGKNPAGVLELVERALTEGYGHAGGLFYLNHQAWLMGINPQTLYPVVVPTQPTVVDLEHAQAQEPWYQGLKEWAVKFGTGAVDAIDSFFQRGRELAVRADDAMKENVILGVILWADYLTGGIASGFVDDLVNDVIGAVNEGTSGTAFREAVQIELDNLNVIFPDRYLTQAVSGTQATHLHTFMARKDRLKTTPSIIVLFVKSHSL